MENHVDTCITGYGVVCGAEVHLNPDCSLEVGEGTLVLLDGTVLHNKGRTFRYYVKPEAIVDNVKKAIFRFLNIKVIDPGHMEFLLLAQEDAKPREIDALKQQHPDDIPDANLLQNKILAVLSLAENPGDQPVIYWLLISQDAIAKSKKIAGHTPGDNQGLFSRPITRREIDLVTIDEYFRPQLLLPVLTVPRLGYKELAIDQPPKGLVDENLLFPYRNLKTFAPLFFEYKAIIDDYIQQLHYALEVLHHNFGSLLSHKGPVYLARYRKFLLLKVKKFYEEGEHLYYIQYIYDWLRDLTLAYNELVYKLVDFRAGCPCKKIKKEGEPDLNLLLLGPVLGGRSTYQPLVFRDLASVSERDKSIRELRFLHWRLLMMIRTFDLPLLKLDRVLLDPGEELGYEEKLDSTNYWEDYNAERAGTIEDEFNWLPVKCTPSGVSWGLLGRMAIPYYYPLDSNSIYSLHQFWDFTSTIMRKTDYLLSYNAHSGDAEKPATETVNDSYTNRLEAILPLAFNLEPYPCLKVEGHIGKRISFTASDGINPVRTGWYFKSFPLFEYLLKYNLCLDVIAFGLPGGDATLQLNKITGLEHRPLIEQGQTLVLFFVDSDKEQIELQECRKDEWPEILPNTVVADFVLPFRIGCCPVAGLTYLNLVPQPNNNA
jgi:hypothetical protein